MADISENGIKRLSKPLHLKKICTIGYTKKSAEDFFKLLKDAGVTLLVDIRLRSGYGTTGFTFPRDLGYFCKIHGIDYDKRLELAPTDEILNAYRDDKDWKKYVESFTRLLGRRKSFAIQKVRNVFYGKHEIICLLCSEPTADKCHRRLVAQSFKMFVENGQDIEIQHLVLKEDVAAKNINNELGGA